MKKNTISYVDKNKLLSLKKDLKALDYFVVKVPGDKIHTARQYLNFMGKEFKMPDYAGFDAYSDWMTDLSWIPNHRIGVIIDDYESFLNKDLRAKEIVIESFTDVVLPFWEKDVVRIMVGGKPRIFEVYIVK
ncbi:barstar family protein [Lactiplantibacillus plantarum]|uniref:barstar family protein n=1 Tax=Lactiplantibacillus plantarum TaxID=1590 RepID=UPI0028029C3D|nr:barstar family protein [Lactiplantibacillus plantarum]MDQ7896036.1 barstar family protein [Lactiplantibacillus plantarum]